MKKDQFRIKIANFKNQFARERPHFHEQGWFRRARQGGR